MYDLPRYIFSLILLVGLAQNSHAQDYWTTCRNMDEAEVPTIIAQQVPTDVHVNIDGRGDESFWSACKVYHLTKSIGSKKPRNDSDFSVKFRMAWDPEHLYVLVDVTDDFYVTLDQRPDCKSWQNDCIEFFVNPDNKTPGKCPDLSSLGDDGSEIHANPGDDDVIANHLAGMGYCHSLAPIKEYLYRSTRTANGYVLEVQMPFTMFNDSLAHLVWQSSADKKIVKFGMDVNACDADDIEADCDNLRDHILSWASDSTDNFMNTSRYGFVLLEKEKK